MVKKDAVILLRDVVNEKSYTDICLKDDIPVICVNRQTGKEKSILFRLLYNNNKTFWEQNNQWEYFFLKEDHAEVLKSISNASRNLFPNMIFLTEQAKSENDKPDTGLGDKYNAIAAMSETDKVLHLAECKNMLDKVISQKPRQKEIVTKALVETTNNVILHNHASLTNILHLSDDEAKKSTQKLVDSTFELVKTSTQLISENIFNDDLMNTLVAKSNGTIIQHMTRVYLNALAFFTFYNNLISSSSIISKLRINFENKYKIFYSKLLPHIQHDKITLERVFLGGMRAISETDFNNWATGFMVHDIGKAAAVEYHEGEAAYNRDVVMEHVKVGYDSLTHKTNYPLDAGLITGYHHEYYGAQDGYGYFRSSFDRQKKENLLTSTPDYCIAFDTQSMIAFKALGFFPAKLLEIIDVFDSITDPNRKYRKPMMTEEALAMMKEEFIIKEPKIDLILFELFTYFIRKKLSS